MKFEGHRLYHNRVVCKNMKCVGVYSLNSGAAISLDFNHIMSLAYYLHTMCIFHLYYFKLISYCVRLGVHTYLISERKYARKKIVDYYKVHVVPISILNKIIKKIAN